MYTVSPPVVYLLLMAAAAALMSQLQVSQRPPQLFQADTNLQRLMDLSANFSDSDISCDHCSGFYMVSA